LNLGAVRFDYAQRPEGIPMYISVGKIVVSASLNNNFSRIFGGPEIENKMKGYMYILECANGKYYVGSTKNLKARIRQHQDGEGANFTWKNLPVRLVYFEEFERMDDAFLREKQVQSWSRQKKEALIYGDKSSLHDFSKCKNDTHYKNKPPNSE
jgi:putative endonuclease